MNGMDIRVSYTPSKCGKMRKLPTAKNDNNNINHRINFAIITVNILCGPLRVGGYKRIKSPLNLTSPKTFRNLTVSLCLKEYCASLSYNV